MKTLDKKYEQQLLDWFDIVPSGIYAGDLDTIVHGGMILDAFNCVHSFSGLYATDNHESSGYIRNLYACMDLQNEGDEFPDYFDAEAVEDATEFSRHIGISLAEAWGHTSESIRLNALSAVCAYYGESEFCDVYHQPDFVLFDPKTMMPVCYERDWKAAV